MCIMKEEMNEHHYPPTTYFTGIFTTGQLCGAVVLPILYRDDTRYYSILDIILHSIRLFWASQASRPAQPQPEVLWHVSIKRIA